MSDSDEIPYSDVEDIEFGDGYDFALMQLMPALELETVLFGMLTMALMMTCHKELRIGIRDMFTLAKGRLVRLAVAITFYVMFLAHWILSVQHARSLFFGYWILNYDSIQQSGLAAPESLHAFFGPLVLETAMFGTFSTLIVYTVYTFMHKDQRGRSQLAMLATALIMYTISLSHWALQARLITVNYTLASGAGPDFINPGVAPLALVTVNVIFSDAIVLWRACVFWRRNMVVYSLSGGLLAFTVALNIANVAVEARLFASTESEINNEDFVQPAFSDSAYGTAALALSLVTNLASTVAIGWKTWRHRREIMRQLADFSRRSIVDKMMALLWESGCVYCVIWILYIISSKSTLLDPAVNLVLVDDGTPVKSVNYFNRLMAQLTGIYPTLILVFVALERNHMNTAFSAPSLSTLVNTPPRRSSDKSKGPQSIQLASMLSRSLGAPARGEDPGGGGLTDAEKTGESASMLANNEDLSPIQLVSKAAVRETLLSIDRGLHPASSTASVRHLYQDATRLLSPSSDTPSSPVEHVGSPDEGRMPTLLALPPSRRTTRSSTGNSRTVSAMRPDTSEGHHTIATSGEEHRNEMDRPAPLTPNRRAPSPLFD